MDRYFLSNVRGRWRVLILALCPKCGMSLERNPVFQESKNTIYTCPMHPQIEQDHPGDCPICGMTLEPKNVVASSDDENAELRDMTRRFWIGAVLSSAGLSACDGAHYASAPPLA